MEVQMHYFEIFDNVINKDVYGGKEVFTVVGIRSNEIEIEGDWSGGTNPVNQKEWCKLKGWETYTPPEKEEIVNQDIIDFRYWLIEEYCKNRNNEVLVKFNTHFGIRNYNLG